ncbi:monoacylglycerol lipase ABHD12-like isoform X1 [Hippocampus zosterae]|uniref:monoacylglycerol lipase ABHD12-like isoform X1 n=1 Tax=Hippocampus zosterae TaxID=109293 RepID=UPI00223CACDB|nr:monoacylglycerol lipase ABHD12-like isoform X1 [Hippocampus zosterae]
MRQRTHKKEVSTSAQKTAQVQRKHENESRWMKRCLFALFVILLLAPFTLIMSRELFQHLVYKHRIKVPFFVDLNQPVDFSLNHTINMYLKSEEGISLGVWHTVPESHWREAQGKDLAWYQRTLSDGNPVFIYLHGNTGTRYGIQSIYVLVRKYGNILRQLALSLEIISNLFLTNHFNRAATHRVGVAKVLSALGYHVLVPDYRGFGDSSGEPTEVGLTTDALHVYNWVKERSGSSLVVFWGHSLGTGVSTNTAVKLIEQGIVLDGVILEGTFNMRNEKLPFHVFSWYYWNFPGWGYFFPEPWAENKVVFPTEENVKKMKSPLLFLHAEDDPIVLIHSAQQLYNVAVSAQNAERVKFVSFEGSLGYLHNGLYKDPRLPDIIKKFVLTL